MSVLLARPVVDDATRRAFLAAVGGAALLPACGAAPITARPATRTFVDDSGTAVEVPDVPRRIFALRGNEMAGVLLALGAPVAVIGAEPGEVDEIRVAGLDPGDAVVVPRNEIDIERVAALAPDLIVAAASDVTNYGPEVFDPLSRIAPVAALDLLTTTVERLTARAADLLGPAATVAPATLQADFDQAFAPLRDAAGTPWDQVTVAHLAAFGDGTFACYSPTATPVNDLLTRLGTRWNALSLRAAEEAKQNRFVTGQSLETIGVLAADLLVHDGEDDLADQPLYQALPQVRAGQVLRYRKVVYGQHLPNYTVVARDLAERIAAMAPLRTGLAP